VAAFEFAPFLRPALAQPEDRGRDIRLHAFGPDHHDRHFRLRRGEDLRAFAIIADGAAIERVLDPVVGEPTPFSDGGGEIGMAAAPMLIGGDVDLKEIGDIRLLGAEEAEFPRPGGVGWIVGRGDGSCGGCRSGVRGLVGWWKFPVTGRITGNFLFFGG
jgi:hypothetical protein